MINLPSRTLLVRAAAVLVYLSLPVIGATLGLAAETTATIAPGGMSGTTNKAGKVGSGNPEKVEKVPSWLAPYNIEWKEPCDSSVDSMPIGGGNIALNVWTTRNELLFYIASTDSWDGKSQVKIGRVRVTLSPNPFVGEFSQKLDLATNSINVRGRAADGTDVELQLWVDVLQPVVHVEGKASNPVNVTAAIELTGSSSGEGRFDATAAVWRFRVSDGPSPQRLASIAQNGIQAIADAVPDPMANHTWGGRLSGTGFAADQTGEIENQGVKSRFWRLATKEPVTRFDLRATLRIAQDPTVEAWEKAVAGLEARTLTTSAADRIKTEAWWRAFWDRSHIVINPGKTVADPAWEVGRNYQLFRAMLAANSSGRMPTLFNGGPFLFENNPNERQWGFAGFTAQNQRLVYWPMLKSGDMDLLKVGLDFYQERHGLVTAWARHFWNIDGAVFTEDIDIFGLPVYTADAQGHTKPEVLRYHYVSGMEFALMMLQSRSYFGNDISRYVPVADGILHFFDQYYRDRDKDGRLVISPGGAIESYQGTTNDAPTIAGLMALSDALLGLPLNLGTSEQRAFWKGFRQRLAPLPIQVCKGERCLAPASSWKSQRPDFNMELPQLYPVFPFRQYGVGLPNLDLARNAWFDGYTCRAKQKNHFCWYQGGIFCAGLGLASEAREYALAKFLHPRWPDPAGEKGWAAQLRLSPWGLVWATPGWKLPRYPAFWDGMTFCGRPDMDHGGAGMIQLQEMLLQTPGDQLNLFPAWPKEWDVDFKLHAPRQTTVEAILRGGKLVSLKVTPTSRMKDVVNWLDRKELSAVSPVILSLNRPVTTSGTSEKPDLTAANITDDDLMSGWSAATEARSAWLEIDLGEAHDISRCWLSESENGNIREFSIEAKDDSDWKEIARGTNIGADKVVKLASCKARYVRLNIIKSDGPIHINEFQVFAQ